MNPDTPFYSRKVEVVESNPMEAEVQGEVEVNDLRDLDEYFRSIFQFEVELQYYVSE
jgi:hypothetical protein